MKYMGSKSRIAKYIVPIIQKYVDDPLYDGYIEPFCGGCNVIDKIKCANRVAYDANRYLIALYQNLSLLKETPKFVTKEHYSEVRDCFNEQEIYFPDWYIGAIGFLASYNGRFFDGGYAGLVTTKSGKIRNYYDEAKRNLECQIKQLENIKFEYSDFQNLPKFSHKVIYCDPPYENTKQYGISKNFDYTKFWGWARELSHDNIVLISECNAPEDFDCIWEQTILRTVDNSKRVESIEKLFKIKA